MNKLIQIFLLLSFSFAGLIKPADNSLLNYVHVLFEWEQMGDTQNYNLSVYQDENIIFDTTTNKIAYTLTDNINWSSNYSWQVCSVETSECWESYQFSTGQSLSNLNTTLLEESSYSDGLTIFGTLEGYYSSAYDRYGNEVWNTGDENLVVYSANEYGQLFGFHWEPNWEHEFPSLEFDFDGNYIWTEPNNEFVHHEFVELPNGDYMGIVEETQNRSVPQGGPWYSECFMQYGTLCNTDFFPWRGDKIVIWDRESKDVVWEWSTFDHYSTQDFDGAYFPDIYGGSWAFAFNFFVYDWTHVNAFWHAPDDNALYISCRHLSRITKIYFNEDDYSDPQNGQIIWNMGQEMPSGDVDCGQDIDFSWQHSVQITDSGTLTFLDNGNLSDDFNEEISSPITRGLEIAVEEGGSGGCEATQVWSYELPAEYFGMASGSMQKLENENYLITTVGNLGNTFEVTPTMNYPEFVMKTNYNLASGLLYRANRISSIHPMSLSIQAWNFTGDATSILSTSQIQSDDGLVHFSIYNNGTIGETFTYSAELSVLSGLLGDEFEVVFADNGDFEISPGNEIVLTVDIGDDLSNEVGAKYTLNLDIESLHNRNFIINRTYGVGIVDDFLDNNQNLKPDNFMISKVYPNPFNPSTSISIYSDTYKNINLQIYDTKGSLVKSLYSGYLNEGLHNFSWNPGKKISSGIYFIKLSSDNSIISKKINYIK